jgi:hypothetical protein
MGRFFACTQFAGSRDTLWLEADEVWVANRDGARALAVPVDLVLRGPEPPPMDGLTTAYDMMHVTGIDLGPYTRLYERFRDLILGRPIPPDPKSATFASIVRASSASRAKGFSQSTCFPAATAASTISAWVWGGVATATASTPGSASASMSRVLACGMS